MTQFHEITNTEQPREITFEELDLRQIKPGEIITGLDSNDAFNALEDKISEQVFGYELPHSWEPSYRNNFTSSKTPVTQGPLARALRPQGRQAKFIGQLRDGTALILPPVPASGRHAGRTGISMLITADMYSTGRSRIGSMARTVAYDFNGNTINSTRKLRRFTNANQARAFVDSLGWEAGSVAQVAAALALQQGELSAGLPSLGKNSR